MAYRLNRGDDDGQSNELWSTIVALLIMTPLVILLFAIASDNGELGPAADAEGSPMAVPIMLPSR